MGNGTFLEWESTDVTYQHQNVCLDLFCILVSFLKSSLSIYQTGKFLNRLVYPKVEKRKKVIKVWSKMRVI